MILTEYLTINNILIAVEILPDGRLINVVTSHNIIHGVHVNNIPENVQVKRLIATLNNTLITTENNLTFNTDDYIML